MSKFVPLAATTHRRPPVTRHPPADRQSAHL